MTEAIDALQDAADTAGCDLDLNLQQMFTGYRLGPREPSVALAGRALRSSVTSRAYGRVAVVPTRTPSV